MVAMDAPTPPADTPTVPREAPREPTTGAAGTRAERHDQNHRRILETAMEMVVAQGFGALSVNKLASALGYTPGALYRYFPSKDAILAALVVDLVEVIGERLRAAVMAHGAELQNAPDPLGSLEAAAWAWRRYAADEPHRFGLIAALLATPQMVIGDPQAAGLAIARTLVALEPLVAAFTSAERLGLLTPGDPKERTLLFFAGLQGVLNLRKQAQRAPDQLDLDRLYAAMIETLMRGFGRADTSLTEATLPGDPR